MDRYRRPSLQVQRPADAYHASKSSSHLVASTYTNHLFQVPGLLSPFTIRLDQVEEFYNRFVEHLHTNEPFRMPGTNVLIKQWPFKLHETRKDNLLSDAGGADRAAERGFTRLYDAISRSDSARRDRLDLEFAPYQPLQGDGILRRKGGETTSSGKPPSHDAEPRPTVPKEWIIEVKEELIREIDDGTVGITMLGARYASKISKPNQAESREGNFQEAEEEGERETRSLSRDMFNPFRTWDFACLFNLAGDSVYLIPCSEIQKEWWTGTIELVIDAAVLKPFRVSLEDELWFDEAYERIILRHPNPKRSASIIPASPNWETAASAYADRTHAPELRYRGQNQPIEAWAKIDRANEECARQGFGVWLRVGHKAKIAEYIFAPFVWSDDDKAIFHANPGTLPVALTAADLSIHMPVLLLRTMMGSRHYNETPAWPTWIHTKDLLERGPFPRLNLVVHIGRSTQRYLHSSLLIPDEFIDVGTILASLSARAGKPVSSYAHLREVLRQAGQTGDYNLRLDMSTLIKKPAHLHEFQVREGWDFHNASQQFMMAHVHPEKLLSWYKPEALHAGLQYCQTFDVVLQELADNFFATGEVDDEEDMDEDLDQPPGDAIRAELAGAGQLDGPVDVAVSVGGQTDGPADAGSDPSDGSDEEDEIDGRRLDWRDLVDVDNPPDYQSDDEYEWTDEDDGWSTEDGEELEEESGEESDGSGEGEDKKPAASEPVQDEDAGSGAEQEVLQTDAKVVER